MTQNTPSPFFSVVIPLFNKEAFIEATLQSVLNQDFSDYEIIVINDGSTDDGLKKIEGLHNKKCIRVINQENAGVSVARNHGGQQAKGAYIAFLDADDIWLTNHLSELKRSIDNYPENAIFCNNYLVEFSKKKFKSIKFNHLKSSKGTIHQIKNYFKHSLSGDIAWTSAVCIKRSVFLDNLFDPNIKSVQDTDLWLRLARKHEFIFNETQTSIYKKYIDANLSKCKDVDNKVCFIEKNKIYESENKYLKSYLDQNRFSMALEYKLIGEKDKFSTLIKELNLSNLSLKRALILNLPAKVVRYLIRYRK